MEDGDLSTPAVKVVGFEVTSEETTAQEGPAQQASPPQPIFALDAEGGSAKVGPGADPSAPEEASQEAQGAAPAQASDPAVGSEETSTLAEEAPVEEDPLVHGNDEVKQALLQAEGVISEAVKDAIAVPEADPNAAPEAWAAAWLWLAVPRSSCCRAKMIFTSSGNSNAARPWYPAAFR